jgi:putative endonuclease
MDDFYVYILRSVKSGSFYIGCSHDPKLRLEQHNWGRVTATKYKRPWILCFLQKFSSFEKARKVEYALKKRKSKVFLEQIVADGEIKGKIASTGE